MKIQSIAFLLAACSVSTATLAQDAGIRESTDPGKVAQIEQHAQMLAQNPGASDASGASGTGDAGASGTGAAGSHKMKKKAHAKHGTSKKAGSAAASDRSGGGGADSGSSSSSSSSSGSTIPGSTTPSGGGAAGAK